jgi:hypothetical protein
VYVKKNSRRSTFDGQGDQQASPQEFSSGFMPLTACNVINNRGTANSTGYLDLKVTIDLPRGNKLPVNGKLNLGKND